MPATRQETGPPIVSVSHLSKKYCRNLRLSLSYGLYDIAREFFWRDAQGHLAALRREEFWALDDISFELRRGESLAVIGANGSGKSTLLKALYGLIKPDRGTISLRGRVGALIELGTGFNPVLSGRENVSVNAAILGLPRRQLSILEQEVADFAGIGEFMDTAVQYYSSGMKARLAYAVAAHLKPDVLLVDEVLAVGDIAYQRKCISNMLKYLDGGGSLIFVSHSLYQIQSACRRGIVLERGRLAFSGTAVEALNYYLETGQREAPAVASVNAQAVVLDDDNPVGIESVRVEAGQGDVIRTGEDFHLTVRYHAREPREVIWGFSIWTADQLICVTGDFEMTARAISKGAGELRCVIPRNPLVAGSYWLRAAIIDPESLQPLALFGWQNAPQPFSVRSHPSELSNALAAINQLVTLDVEWERTN
jgi:ABC-type polysaccharide/polyol phosphate transport system ATPase subunit